MIKRYRALPSSKTVIFFLVGMFALYFISRHNYNLFHSFVDGVSIVIAACVFTIIWNGRLLVDNTYFLYVGISLLFFAFWDFLHLLGNKNMGVFPEYGNLGPALYIVSRYFLSLSLLFAPLFINRKLNTTLMYAAYALVTVVILLSIFYWRTFPVCIVEGLGLTPFKIVSDYIICVILLGAIALLLLHRRFFETRVMGMIVSSMILCIATGLAFTLYVDPFGIMNAVGHFFQISSFYLIYLAFIETSLTSPQDILYQRLKSKEVKLAENVEQLHDTTEKLQQEIIDRIQAEEALRDSETRFKALHNASFGGIAIHDRGTILECNLGLSEMTGYGAGELIGMNGLLLISERSRDTVMSNILSGYEKPYEADGLRKNGEEYPLRLEARIIPYKGKDVQTVEFRDITEAKQNEEQNSKLASQLQQSQKMEAIGQLAGGVAHDFNNMLGVIIGYADLLIEKMKPTRAGHSELEEIRKAAVRSADLTRQLLTFARKETVAPKVLDLNQTIEGMFNMLRRLIGENIDLIWMPGSGLWPIKMDPSQIDQILANLCVNTRDAIDSVGKLTVQTQNITFDETCCETPPGAVAGEYVRITFTDTGKGMDKQTLARIFEPFFTTKGVGEGTGLGLATVYGAVKQNNGYIIAYSEPGQGTSFTIDIPRHVATTQKMHPIESAEAIIRGHEVIVLVEDEPTVLAMGKMMLERLGYTVMAAGTPREAIRLASGFPGQIDLLATDVIMPEMNGRELAERLGKSRPEMKCLFMSGYTANVIADQGVLQEGVSFLQKPFSKKDLAAKVREILDG